MTMRRLLLISGIALILFLGMYSWNSRTRVLDNAAANVGLEIYAAVLRPVRAAEAYVGDFWTRYFDLVDVRGENLRLKAKVEELEARLLGAGEDLAELRRLRALVQFPVDVRWRPLAARVLAGRLGPNGVLDSITISRGYTNGARPGTPLVTHLGLVGRILRASPHASTALLITDPSSNIAVFGQESRAAGILKGCGMGQAMEVDFVQRDSGMKDGELLVTSGLDNKYPKGLPVARINRLAPSDYTQFMAVEASPLVDLRHLEEVLLLEKSGVDLPAAEETDAEPKVLVGPPLPPNLVNKQAAKPELAQSRAAPAATQPVARKQATASGADSSAANADQSANPASAEAAANRGAQGASVPARRPAPVNGQPARAVSPPPQSGPSRPAAQNNVPRSADGAPRYRVIIP